MGRNKCRLVATRIYQTFVGIGCFHFQGKRFRDYVIIVGAFNFENGNVQRVPYVLKIYKNI